MTATMVMEADEEVGAGVEAGAGPEERTEVVRYRDAWGHLQELRVTSRDARAIRRVRMAALRQDAHWRERNRTFTDLEIESDRLVDEAVKRLGKPPDLGYAPEGPDFTFSILIGVGPTWPGPLRKGQRCPFCGGWRLWKQMLCIYCVRSGRDNMIPFPTKSDLARRNKMFKPDPKLKGGLKGKS